MSTAFSGVGKYSKSSWQLGFDGHGKCYSHSDLEKYYSNSILEQPLSHIVNSIRKVKDKGANASYRSCNREMKTRSAVLWELFRLSVGNMASVSLSPRRWGCSMGRWCSVAGAGGISLIRCWKTDDQPISTTARRPWVSAENETGTGFSLEWTRCASYSPVKPTE